MQSDRELVKEARERSPEIVQALEKLPTDRLVYLEAHAVRTAFRLRADAASGKMIGRVLPSPASRAGRIIEAILRERRRLEKKAAERAARAAAIKAAADQTETKIAA
jgi:hypothetical protein